MDHYVNEASDFEFCIVNEYSKPIKGGYFPDDEGQLVSKGRPLNHALCAWHGEAS